MRKIDAELFEKVLYDYLGRSTIDSKIGERRKRKHIIDDVCRLLRIQPTADNWIPCSERLPNREEYLKNDGRFIGYGGNKVYPVVFDIYTRKFCSYTYFGLLVDDNSIKRWQPLPEPYKGG